MKKILFLILSLLAISTSYAQFVTPLTGTTVTNDNIGIGTNSPQSTLDIGKNVQYPAFRIGNSGYLNRYNSIWGMQADASSIMIFGNNNKNEIRAGNTDPGGFLDFYTNNTANYTTISDGVFTMRLANNGYVGIGTTTPVEKLNVSSSGSSPQFVITQNNWTSSGANWYFQSVNGKFYIGNSTGAGGAYSALSDRLIIDNTGKVGIGTSSPDAKLAVQGTIHATEVLVDQTVPTPDYVFDKDYDLTSLKDVKTYIDQNHHLPEIPSAAQVAKEGINLGEMNAKLLKKIEELTLYLIEKDKKQEALETMLLKQNKAIRSQQRHIAVLERKNN